MKLKPTINELIEIHKAVWYQMGVYQYAVRIVFTGSAVLNILGLMDREIKDVDLIFVGDRVFEEKLMLTLSNGKYETDFMNPSTEKLFSLKILDYNVEIFWEEKMDYITTAYGFGIAKADHIFRKKFEFDVVKAICDLNIIKKNLENLKPITQ